MDTPPPSKFSYSQNLAPCEPCARPETYGVRVAFGMATFAAGFAGAATGFALGSWKHDALTGVGLGALGGVGSAISVYAMGRATTYMIDSGFDLLDQSANAAWEGTKWVICLPFRACYQVGALALQILGLKGES